MLYHLRHRTSFQYSQPVTVVFNAVHLKPRTLPWQTVHASTLRIAPEPAVLTERLDYFGNHAAYFSVQKQHTQMDISIESLVEVLPRSPASGNAPAWKDALALLKQDVSADGLAAYQFCFPTANLPALTAAGKYCAPSCKNHFSVHDLAHDLMQRIFSEYTFDPIATTVTTPVEEVLETRRGVCQDFAHLMISCLRSVGVAARYTSGYIQTLPPPGKPRLIGADASHAWVGVYCPTHGWADFDPTNNRMVDDQYITTAWGRDYFDVSPVNGLIVGGGEHQVTAMVDMVPADGALQTLSQTTTSLYHR